MDALFFVGTLAVMALLAWHELNVYTRLKLQKKDSQPVRARLGRRLLGLVVLFVVVTMTYVGVRNLRSFPSPSTFITYWTICFFLLVFLMVLVVFDLRAVYKQVLRSMIDEAAEERRFQEFLERQVRLEARKQQKSAGTPPEKLGNLHPAQESRGQSNKTGRSS
ncbi:MAG: hypothetical protein K1Y36_01155 [Blastocatellia bacterium]|nr:hypothetical protein [Blastocatellia bacterium]